MLLWECLGENHVWIVHPRKSVDLGSSRYRRETLDEMVGLLRPRDNRDEMDNSRPSGDLLQISKVVQCWHIRPDEWTGTCFMRPETCTVEDTPQDWILPCVKAIYVKE